MWHLKWNYYEWFKPLFQELDLAGSSECVKQLCESTVPVSDEDQKSAVHCPVTE